MYRYKRLVIVLNLTDSDTTLVRYADMVSRMAKSEKAYFVHVIDHSEIPDSIRKKHPEIHQISSEAIEHKMKGLVKENFVSHSKIETFFETPKGPTLTELLRFIRKYDIDLILTGKPNDGKPEIVLAKRLARKAPCSVCIIPEIAKVTIESILVGLDFSDHSTDAFDVAVAFARAIGYATLYCLHAYRVPRQDYHTGISRAQFAATLLESAQLSFQSLKEKYHLKGINVRPLFVDDEHPADAIQEAAGNRGADLIVIGSRGRGSTAAEFVLGSVTEELIGILNVPLLAVKRKGDGMSLLEALFNL